MPVLSTMDSWLIDRNGDQWRCGDPHLSGALGTTLSGKELAHFATTNMGFVGLERVGRRLQVRCRPARIGELTFAGLCYFLLDHPWRPVALTLLSEQWATRIFPDAAEVVETLSRLVPRNTLDVSQAILSAPLQPERSPLLAKMRAMRPIMTDTPDYDLLDRVFAGRWSIGHFDAASTDAAAGRYVFDHMGTGFRRSTLMETLDDNHYAGWVQQSRGAALASAEPVFEAIDAFANTSNGRARLCYHRVMQTITSSSGHRSVFSAAIDDTSIDLRKAS